MEKMDEKALLIVSKYAREHLDKTDGPIEFSTFIVWKCKILQNWKFLISTSLHDGTERIMLEGSVEDYI